MKDNIDQKSLENFKKQYKSEEKHTILRHALSKTEMSKVVSSQDFKSDTSFTFNIEVKTLPVCDQKRSGRCWIFSASTILREIVNKKLHVKDQFEISQNYIAFYDKLEKYNYYMENLIQLCLKGLPNDDRRVAFLLAGVGDGGQWDMYVSLVKKYGIVPKAVFDETAQSNNTHLSTTLLNAAMRKFASQIYALKEQGAGLEKMEELKTSVMEKVYCVLCDSFGVPPEKFDYEYIDEKGEYHILKDRTPKSFFEEYVGQEIEEYVSLIHAPTKDKEYYQTYNIDLVGNVYDGKPITHLNLPMERIEELIVTQLKNAELVWFGSDVSYYGDRENGVWDNQSFDYQSAFGIDFLFDKKDMLDFSNSMMNHAMVISGVNVKEGIPTRFKIENSWGDSLGKKGFFIISKSWFDSFVYQAAIKKKYLNEKELKALEKKPVLLPPWDPFGTLAD